MTAAVVAVLIAALVLAAPGTALAQSAGDEQYQDPFAGDDQSQATPTPRRRARLRRPLRRRRRRRRRRTATPDLRLRRAAAQEQLPRTGNDPITPAVAGFWILLGGVALRARVRVR